MKGNHWLVAAACVVSLGLGYVAGGSRTTAGTGGKQEGPSAEPRQTRSSSRDRETRGNSADELLAGILKGRSAKDLPDSELVEVLLQLSKEDPSLSPVARARQRYQLQLLLEKLPASRLEQAAEALAADPDNKRSGSINTILTAMASKDPQRAMEWAKTQKNASSLLASVLGTMAKDDPMTAADIYREGLLDGTFGRNDGWSASYGIGQAMARLGRKALFNFMDQLPQQQQGNILSNCYRELPEDDRMGMIDEVYQRSKDGRIQEWSFKNIFSNALSTDRARAEAWLAKMEPGKERAALELSAANSLSRNGDPDAAVEWMSRAIAGSRGREKELLKDALNEMAYNNAGDLATFVSLLPEGVELRAEDLKNHSRNMAYNGFENLPGLASAIRDPSERAKFITNTLEEIATHTTENSGGSRVNDTDFEILARRLQKLDLTGDDAARIQDALATARNARPKRKE